MSIWKKILQVCLIVFLALFIDVFFGRWITAQLSTFPFLGKWKILAPQAPIVINTKEQVSVSDSGDILSAVELVKPKLSLVVNTNDGLVTPIAGALNLTSDGLFVTSPGSFPSASANYFVILENGQTAKIGNKTIDPATGLIFFQADINNVPTAVLGESAGLLPGQRVVSLLDSVKSYTPKFFASFVEDSQSDFGGKIFDADHPSMSFTIQDASLLKPGQAIADLHGEVVGFWSGSSLISSDLINQAVSNFLDNNRTFIRPEFGFAYYQIGKIESSLLNVPQGAKIISIKNGRIGLQTGDIITKVNSDSVNEATPLEALLQKYSVGDKINLTIVRNGQDLGITLTIGQLTK